MNLDKKIFVLGIFIIFISICGVYSAFDYHNNEGIHVISNETDAYGCCSIVLQLENNDTLMSYRRDSNVSADVTIEKINWHGIPAIKQSKTDGGEFTHVIITNNGWVIGLGGIDDGVDNQICENITANMISKDNSISQYALSKIQKIKQPYGRGHVVVKAPNGNYGFATVDKLKTGKLDPGTYISIPNDYSLSRRGNVSLDTPDKVKVMNELSSSDLYGLDRREIITYYFNSSDEGNTTNIYVSNEDGSFLGANYTGCIDNIIFNDTTISGKSIPISPNYKNIGSISFADENTTAAKLVLLIFIVVFVVIVGILFYVLLKFVRFMRYKYRRKF